MNRDTWVDDYDRYEELDVNDWEEDVDTVLVDRRQRLVIRDATLKEGSWITSDTFAELDKCI